MGLDLFLNEMCRAGGGGGAGGEGGFMMLNTWSGDKKTSQKKGCGNTLGRLDCWSVPRRNCLVDSVKSWYPQSRSLFILPTTSFRGSLKASR